MKNYVVNVEPEALADIQDITDWYNEVQNNLGKKFQNQVVKQINSLIKDPQIHAIRYKSIRCMLVKKFPYMVHFYINEETIVVEVLSVISTDRNPKVGEGKTSK